MLLGELYCQPRGGEEEREVPHGEVRGPPDGTHQVGGCC